MVPNHATHNVWVYYILNYDDMPETFATWEEQRNNYLLAKEKEKYV